MDLREKPTAYPRFQLLLQLYTVWSLFMFFNYIESDYDLNKEPKPVTCYLNFLFVTDVILYIYLNWKQGVNCWKIIINSTDMEGIVMAYIVSAPKMFLEALGKTAKIAVYARIQMTHTHKHYDQHLRYAVQLMFHYLMLLSPCVIFRCIPSQHFLCYLLDVFRRFSTPSSGAFSH